MPEEIFVKNIENKTVRLEVELKTDSLKRIVHEYADKVGVEENTVQLIHSGKPLDVHTRGDMKLEDLDIEDKSTLFAVMRLKGGNQVTVTV